MAKLKSERKETGKILADLHLGERHFCLFVCTYKPRETNLGAGVMLAFSSNLIFEKQIFTLIYLCCGKSVFPMLWPKASSRILTLMHIGWLSSTWDQVKSAPRTRRRPAQTHVHRVPGFPHRKLLGRSMAFTLCYHSTHLDWSTSYIKLMVSIPGKKSP